MQGPNIFCFDLQLFIFLLLCILVLSLCDIRLMPVPISEVDSSWNVMARGDPREGKWMEWVASTLHTTSEHGVSSITTADAHTSAVSSRLNWCPRRFKWTHPFRRKTNSSFCVCAITFQLACTIVLRRSLLLLRLCLRSGIECFVSIHICLSISLSVSDRARLSGRPAGQVPGAPAYRAL